MPTPAERSIHTVSLFEGDPLRSPEWKRYDHLKRRMVPANDLWRTKRVSREASVAFADMPGVVIGNRWSPARYTPATIADSEGYAPVYASTGRLMRRRMHTGRRHKFSFRSASVAALDFDGTIPLRDAITRCEALGWSAFIGSSRSHGTKEGDRLRLIVELDRAVTDPDQYHAVLRWIVDEVFPEADPQCLDTARFYFGCRELLWSNFDGRVLSPDVILDESGYTVPPDHRSMDVRRLQRSWLPIGHCLPWTREKSDKRMLQKSEAKSLISGGDPESEAVGALLASPPGISGCHGSNTTYRAMMAAGYALAESASIDLLTDLTMRYYNPRCTPIWERSDIERKAQDVMEWMSTHPRVTGKRPRRSQARPKTPRPEHKDVLARMATERKAARKARAAANGQRVGDVVAAAATGGGPGPGEERGLGEDSVRVTDGVASIDRLPDLHDSSGHRPAPQWSFWVKSDLPIKMFYWNIDKPCKKEKGNIPVDRSQRVATGSQRSTSRRTS